MQTKIQFKSKCLEVKKLKRGEKNTHTDLLSRNSESHTGTGLNHTRLDSTKPRCRCTGEGWHAAKRTAGGRGIWQLLKVREWWGCWRCGGCRCRGGTDTPGIIPSRGSRRGGGCGGAGWHGLAWGFFWSQLIKFQVLDLFDALWVTHTHTQRKNGGNAADRWNHVVGFSLSQEINENGTKGQVEQLPPLEAASSAMVMDFIQYIYPTNCWARFNGHDTITSSMNYEAKTKVNWSCTCRLTCYTTFSTKCFMDTTYKQQSGHM